MNFRITILSPTIQSNIPFNLVNLDDGKVITAEINTIVGVRAVHSDTIRIFNTGEYKDTPSTRTASPNSDKINAVK